MDVGASAGNGYGRFTEMSAGAAVTADELSKLQCSPAGAVCVISGGLNGSSGFHAVALVNSPALGTLQPELV
jgi:hypothetical protein